jgi:hypothetical protein
MFRRGARLDDAFSVAFPGCSEGGQKNVSLDVDLDKRCVLLVNAGDDASIASERRALACFGSPTDMRKGDKDLAFPMRDVTEEKLVASFGPLLAPGAHGTVQSFPSGLIRPTADGCGVEVLRSRGEFGDKYTSVAEHFAQWWWLPPSSGIRWEEQLPGGKARAAELRARPFSLVVRGPAGSTAVDWSAHGWERICGHASGVTELPFVLGNTKHRLLVQLSWVTDLTDPLQEAVASKMLLYKGGRFLQTADMPIAFKGLQLPKDLQADSARSTYYRDIDTSGPAQFKHAHDDLCANLYGGPNMFPVAKEDMGSLEKANLHSALCVARASLCSLTAAQRCSETGS